MLDPKTVERKQLLKRIFSRGQIFEIGKALGVSYFSRFFSKWSIDLEKATLEISLNINDSQLKEFATHYRPRKWQTFSGENYTFEKGELRIEGSWNKIQLAVIQAKRKFGKNSIIVFKRMLESPQGVTEKEIRNLLPSKVDPQPILSDLEKAEVIVASYKGRELKEWIVPEEMSPMIQRELGLAEGIEGRMKVRSVQSSERQSPLAEEQQTIQKMDREFEEYLQQLLRQRVEKTLTFGRSFSINSLAQYLKDLFGPVLYFDALLAITQQYGLANVEIRHQEGDTGMRTGWNLSLFGEPGTGKSFSTRDLILGKSEKVHPHGIPGRNRYAGGMTPARFIRIGQAYSGRVFNFIIPEFNEWFKYKGMVESLKIAMEHGEVRSETFREVIGPYRLTSFFSVNYNVAVYGRGYEVTIKDPNFNAIEDRMLCRLHRLTKQRFEEIAESQMRLALGKVDFEKGSQQLRDHLTLVYAAETEHPQVKGRFPRKPVMLTNKALEMLTEARKAILSEIPRENVGFSARLESRALSLACAASLLNYFQSDHDYITVSEEALKTAIQLYVEEASVRSRGEFTPESVLEKLSIT